MEPLVVPGATTRHGGPVRRVGFDAWVQAAGPRLHRAAFLLTGDSQDLAQHACAATWPRFDSLDEPVAFARTVMARTASSWWRRKWRGEVPHGDIPEPARLWCAARRRRRQGRRLR